MCVYRQTVYKYIIKVTWKAQWHLDIYILNIERLFDYLKKECGVLRVNTKVCIFCI